MSSMDKPPRRPLDDHDQAQEAPARPGVPDGRPRSPAELFDNLRLRLSELPPNHPSAPPGARRSRPSDGAARSGRSVPADRTDPPGRPRPHDQVERTDEYDPPGEGDAPCEGDPPREGDPPGEGDRADEVDAAGEGDAPGEGDLAGERDAPGEHDQPDDTAPRDDTAGPDEPLDPAVRAFGAAGDALSEGSDGSGLAMIDFSDLVSPSEGYRPWFMSGEPGSPWWAADDDLWD